MLAGKLYYEALKTLPDKFVDDETRATAWHDDMIVAANPKFAPIIYTHETGWQEIKLTDFKKPKL